MRAKLADGKEQDMTAMTNTTRTRSTNAAARPRVAASSFVAGLAGGLVAGRLLSRERVQFMRLAGSSIAAPGAAGWITDFLNAAYYRRSPAHREVDDLRLAHAIITT